MASRRIKTAVIQTAARRKAMQARVVNNPKPPKVEGQEPKHKLTPELEANMEKVKQGEIRSYGAAPGKRLMTRIKEVLGERSLRDDPETGGKCINTRFDDVADAFVRQMEGGNFQHVKEFLERDEGKVTEKIALVDDAVKMYVDTPTEGPDAP